MMSGTMVTISQKELIDRPNVIRVVKVIGGRAYSISCLPKQKHFGRRLICPLCNRFVETVYLPEEKDEFGCGQCYKTILRRTYRSPTYKLLKKMNRQWPDKQY